MIATVELPKPPEYHIRDSDTDLEPGIYRDRTRTTIVVAGAKRGKVVFENGKLRAEWGFDGWYTKLPEGTTLAVSMDGDNVRCVVRLHEEEFHLRVEMGMLKGKYLSSCGHVLIRKDDSDDSDDFIVIPTAEATEYQGLFRRLPDGAKITIV